MIYLGISGCCCYELSARKPFSVVFFYQIMYKRWPLAVSEYFYEVTVNGKAASKYKNCGNVQSKKASRMKTHVMNCVEKASTECGSTQITQASRCDSKWEQIDELF